MLLRDISSTLTGWKAKQNHHPLVLSGLRQTGKTYSVRRFGEANYAHVIYLDLRANKAVHTAFAGDFDVNKMVLSITANEPSARFVARETLLILDEIQDCPDARSSLKYWDQDGRYDVIATGSFLGVKGFRNAYRRGIPVGYEEKLTMYPLTFREFLDNSGMSHDVISYAEEALKRNQPVEPAVHERLRTLFLYYLVAGGMPEAVSTFFETSDLNAVREVQWRILSSIRDDLGRRTDAKGNDTINEVLKLRAEACLDSLPSQLAKDYKKFQYSLVNAKGHSPEKAEGLQYLVDLGLVTRVHNLREISAPLEAAKIPNEFKVYFADPGLLMSQLEPWTAPRVLTGDLSAYKGAMMENAIAAAFCSSGKSLYYYRERSGSPELDFVFSDEGVPTLVECKATNRRPTSLKFVLENPKRFGRHPAVKFADTNVGGGDGFVTLPLYAVGLMNRG